MTERGGKPGNQQGLNNEQLIKKHQEELNRLHRLPNDTNGLMTTYCMEVLRGVIVRIIPGNNSKKQS